MTTTNTIIANTNTEAVSPKTFMLSLRDVVARMESIDYDLESDSLSRQAVETAMASKAKAIDVMNYMTRHNMQGVVFSPDPKLGVGVGLSERIEYAYFSIFGEASNIMEEKQMILMQGVPGSGKSSIANMLANHINAMVVSNNDFMTDSAGNYVFNPHRLNECIEACQNAAEAHAEAGWNLIVDNVNAEGFCVDYYMDLAARYNYRVMVIRTSRSSDECFNENIHGVPTNSIISMHSRLSDLLN